MRPTIEQLQNTDRYELIDSFRIDEMAQFLTRELGFTRKDTAQKPTPKKWMSWVFLLVLAIGGAIIGYMLGAAFVGEGSKADETIRMMKSAQRTSIIGQFGFAFVAFFILLPIHEVTHALVFKYYGATNVGFGGSWKSLIVYAYAQKFVHTGRELAWIAVMPFLIITALLVIAWIVWPQYGVFFGATLFIHTTACIGDFVLINYQYKNRHRLIYTYDDLKEEKRSYFFAERG